MPGFKFQGVYPRKNVVVGPPCFSASYPQGVRVPPVKNHWSKPLCGPQQSFNKIYNNLFNRLRSAIKHSVTFVLL